MTLLYLVETALRSIAASPLRSALTTLGIVIGVGSVIVMGAVGAGARHEVDKQISNLGTNVLVINPSAQVYGGRSSGPGTNRPLSEDDLLAIESKVEGIVAITGQLWASATVVRGNANTWTRIWGVHKQYLELRNWSLESGRDISEQDIVGRKRVALIGQSVAKVLFGDEDPLGQTLRARGFPFTIIGVLSAKGKSFSGEDHDDTVLVPMATARRYLIGTNRLTPFQVGQVSVKFQEGVNLADVQEDIGRVLRQSRRVAPGSDDNFNIGNLTEATKARTAAQATLGWLLGATAAISLIVGGIGIMSIMLVSVTERTREIGLRKALGARGRDITLQFLVESVTLCVLGGLVGIGLGISAAYTTARLAGWPVIVTSEIILMALSAAIATGLIFGILPARQAANLNPIDGLRSE